MQQNENENTIVIIMFILIFASQGLRFGSPFSPPLADLEYILKFARNATWWLSKLRPLDSHHRQPIRIVLLYVCWRVENGSAQ